MCLLNDWGVTSSTFLPNKPSKKKDNSIKLSKLFFSGINSTNKSTSLVSLTVSFENDPKIPKLFTPNDLILSLFSEKACKRSYLELYCNVFIVDVLIACIYTQILIYGVFLEEMRLDSYNKNLCIEFSNSFLQQGIIHI